MTADPREELISAYLDGEASPAERAQVEQMMAAEPAWRQLHDELAALRSTMQTLPRHKLERDLGPTVLRRAEQSVLRGAAATDDARPTISLGQWWSRGAGWRRLAWPALAVAAALVIALFDSEEQAPREVAQAPKGETAITAQPAPPAAAAPASPAAPVARRAADAYSQPQAARVEAPGRPLPEISAQQAGEPNIVLGVRTAYFQDNRFEKLLTEQKVPWKADTTGETPAPKALRASPVADENKVAAERGAPTRRVYVVEATPSQLEALMAALRGNTEDVRQITDRRAGGSGERSAVEAQSFRILLQALPGPAADDTKH
jgi:hypothetical protein